jgi:chemotaxis signal transduction protein
MSTQDIEKELRERAARLARNAASSRRIVTESFVSFIIGKQCFGVPLGAVVYAGRLRHLTPIPSAPPYLLGITLIAGHLISVLDIAALLSLRRPGVGDVTSCLIIESGPRKIGLAAEQTLGIEEIPQDQISELALGGATAPIRRAAFVERMHILLLDPQAILADPRLQGGNAHG